MFSSLVSKTTLQHFLYRILTQWIVFQEKYEVFRHLIKDKDNKYENNKINKQYGQVRF